MTAARGRVLAVVVVVAGTWLSSTIWALRGPLDLGFTTSNVAWLLANAWLWPTVLLVLGAAAVRSRPLAVAGLVGSAVGVLAFAIILVVQLVLGARSELVASSVPALLTLLATAVAAILIVAGRRHPGMGVAALVVAGLAALATLLVEVRALAAGLVGAAPLDALGLLAVALASLGTVGVGVAIALLAVRAHGIRLVCAGLLALVALVGIAGAISSLGGLGLSAGAGRLVEALALAAAAVILVVARRDAPGTTAVTSGSAAAWDGQQQRSAQTFAAQPFAARPIDATPTAQQGHRAPPASPPPPAPGSRVPGPQAPPSAQ